MDNISFTRNFEDVMLNRALSAVRNGFYIDVGAYHPVVDSNTYAFYRRGWRGIAIEPQPDFRDLWALQRPLDLLLNMAAGAINGEATFFETAFQDQNATISPEIADLHRREGRQVRERKVTVATLDQILETHRPAGEIHCLSIDVEGAEKAVLQGLDRRRFRPWLIVVESTLPNRPEPNFQAWESLLLETGYEFAYFDAVNRFYVSQEHTDLKAQFKYPPCVWDGFIDHRLLRAAEEAEQAKAELVRLKQHLRTLGEG